MIIRACLAMTFTHRRPRGDGNIHRPRMILAINIVSP
jgi:hypothetical protein